MLNFFIVFGLVIIIAYRTITFWKLLMKWFEKQQKKFTIY